MADTEYTREQRLERALADMEARKDGAYEERNKVVAALAKLFPSGITRTAIEGWSEDWHGCVYIDLPTGQVSWHFHDSQAYLFDGLPLYTGVWDGHDTPEKYRRLAALPSASLGEQREAVAVDRGPWVAQRWPDGRVVLQSDDFTHDTALIVDGDFGSNEQRLEYAMGLAAQFNAASPASKSAGPLSADQQEQSRGGEHG